MNTQETVRNVLIAVDPQNDFITGSLAVDGGEQVIAPLNEMTEIVRATGGDVAFTRDWHPAETPHFNTWPVHCVQDTEGAAFASELTIKPTDIIISKGTGQTDGYSGTEGVGPNGETLEALIEPRSKEERVRVFIGGLATDYCVLATALALAEQFKDNERVTFYLIRDAVRAVNLEPDAGEKAIRTMEDATIVAMTVAEIKQMFFEKERIQL